MSAIKYYDTTSGTWKYLSQGPKGDKGSDGTNGTNGTNGQGVPTGGTTGQALVKKSGTDYDTQWQAITTGVSSVDGLTGAVSLTSSYDAKGTAALKSKFDAFLAKATGPINAFPTANSTNITVTTSAVSGATVYAYNSGKFYYRGLVPSVVTNSGVSYYRNDPISHLSYNVFWVEFDHYGTNFDVRHSRADENKYAQIWVWVDGVPVTTTPAANYSATGALAYYNVSFSGAAQQRRIRVMIGAADFAGIGLASDKDTIFPVEQKLLKVVFFGGSWFDGGSGYPTGSTAYLNEQLSVQLGEMMNVDYYVNAWGGTGYYNGIATSPSNNWSAASRINPVINTIQPDLIVFFGTTNDDFYASSLISAQAASAYSQILAALPNTKLIVFTRQSNTVTTTGSGTGTAVNESAVTAAANAASNVIGVVNPWTEQWVNGTYGSSGTGNGSIYIYTDAHPTPAGNRYYATRTFNRIVDIIKTYTRS
jgi:hypothetical protein